MTDLSGLKVLVVEDEGSIALLIEDMLIDLGCQIAASVAQLAQACKIAATVLIDFAVLDINLNGERVFAVAEILQERGIPFLFSTGYGTTGVPAAFERHPVLCKPFTLDNLRQAISKALNA
jgi:CheY-like chemotaxis protein